MLYYLLVEEEAFLPHGEDGKAINVASLLTNPAPLGTEILEEDSYLRIKKDSGLQSGNRLFTVELDPRSFRHAINQRP